jgi:peptidoglycan/LPS O-acetylase OafA/YrhL
MFQAGRPGAYGSFLARRVARVVPLNVAVLLLLVLVETLSLHLLGRAMLFHGAWLPFDLPANVLMLQGLGIGINLNGPSWSISVEFVAYLVFPLLLTLVFARVAIMRWLALALALGGLVALALGQKRLGLSYEGPPLALVRCLTEFTLGMFAYRLYRDDRANWLGDDRVAAALALGAAASLTLRYDLPAALLFVPIVVAFALNRGWPAQLLCHPVPYFLGVVSFSLYLLHNGVRPFALLLLQHLHPAPLSTVPALGFALACSIAVVPLAWLGYVLVERPGRRWSRSLLRVW